MVKSPHTFSQCIIAIILLLLITACESDHDNDGHWLCSVKSDGTEFTRVFQNKYQTTGNFWEDNYHYIDYLTKVKCSSNKLFLTYNDSYKICNQHGTNLHIEMKNVGTLSNDGNYAYAIRNNALYKYDFSTEQSTLLNSNIGNLKSCS